MIGNPFLYLNSEEEYMFKNLSKVPTFNVEWKNKFIQQKKMMNTGS